MPTHPFDSARNAANPLQDAVDYAHDLAYGAIIGEWGPILSSFRGSPNFLDTSRPLHAKFNTKWNDPEAQPPILSLLDSLGYLEFQPVANSQTQNWRITRTAFDLLKSPFMPARTFISYRRRESSAMALLVEARLRIAGVPIESIFLDKNMTGGERWEARIYREIEQSDYFVCLLGPTTLAEGSWVTREIELLRQIRPQAAVIPVCHSGMRLSDLPPTLTSSNGYQIGKPQGEETALDYEMAVNFVLNAMGYRTY